VQDVVPTGAEAQLHRLDVDHDVVAESHGPGEPRVRNARASLNLETNEALCSLVHRAHAAAAKVKRHERRR
jgi:hypothetical protein